MDIIKSKLIASWFVKYFIPILLLIISYATVGQENRYENKKYRYSIAFPKNWTIKEEIKLDLPKTTATNSTFATESSDYGEITVLVIPNVSAGKLKTFMENDIEIAKNSGASFNLIRNQSLILNGNSAIVIEISIIMANNQKARMINYGISKNSNLYFIRCFANEKFYKKSIEIINTACNSFDVK